jgi:hypothetical protein
MGILPERGALGDVIRLPKAFAGAFADSLDVLYNQNSHG